MDLGRTECYQSDLQLDTIWLPYQCCPTSMPHHCYQSLRQQHRLLGIRFLNHVPRVLLYPVVRNFGEADPQQNRHRPLQILLGVGASGRQHRVVSALEIVDRHYFNLIHLWYSLLPPIPQYKISLSSMAIYHMLETHRFDLWGTKFTVFSAAIAQLAGIWCLRVASIIFCKLTN